MSRNEKINLSAIRTPQEIYSKHILDSLELNKILNIENGKLVANDQSALSGDALKDVINDKVTLLDLGTGGGFPLLPLAISNPSTQCYGLDSTKKKLTAVQEIASELNLKNVKTIWSRAEDHKEKYTIVTSRAVGYADKLLGRARPLVIKGGLICLYKQLTEVEDNLILSLVRTNNMELIRLHHYTLPNDETPRVLYLLQK